jgi:pilus assembly protein CpaE
MGNETALFEDDFGTEFEDVFNEDTLTGANDFGPVTGAASQPVQAVAGFVAKPTTAPVSNFMPLEQGGDAMLPAISIKLFYEREETRALMQLCAKDRRMGRGYAKTQNWKKAIVTLRDGDTIAAFEPPTE